MRKTVLILLCALTVLSFAGCKDTGKTSHSVDIEYFANMGAVPESELKIGDSVPEIEEYDDNYFVSSDGDDSFFSNGEFNFFYDTSEKEPKINKIACFSKSFGFEIGDISIEIINALEDAGIKYTERAEKDGELSFLPKSDNRSVVECRSLKHKLVFVFEDNALCATVIE